MNKIDKAQKYMFKGEYEKAYELLSSEKDPLSLIYFLTTLLGLGKIDEGLEVIEKYHHLLEGEFLPSLIELHISFLRHNLDVVGLMKAKEYYNNLPYHSQVVEEKLRSFDDIIKATIKELGRKERTLSLDEIKNLLHSPEMNDVYDGVLALHNFKTKEVVSFIQDELINNPNIYARSALLIYLGESDCDIKFSFKNSMNQIVEIVPKEIIKYHSEAHSEKNLKRINKYLNKDTTLEGIAKSLYVLYELTIMPDYVKEDDEVFFEALAHLAKQYMNIEEETSKVVSDLANEIRVAISQFE